MSLRDSVKTATGLFAILRSVLVQTHFLPCDWNNLLQCSGLADSAVLMVTAAAALTWTDAATWTTSRPMTSSNYRK
jgi:hypothetical protein